MSAKPSISIEYCTVCKFGGRAAWLAQELLNAHETAIAAIALVPGRGGIFEVRIDGELAFSYEAEGRFPEPRDLKDALRAKLGMEPSSRHD